MKVDLDSYLGKAKDLRPELVEIDDSDYRAKVAQAAVTTLSLRERGFVEASVISGGGSLHVVRKHLLPNAIGPLLVSLSLTAAYALLAAATLSYLGLGEPPPSPSWGSMLQDAFGYPFQAWWYGVFPGICIVWCAFGYVLISQGIEHAIARGRSRVVASALATAEVVLGASHIDAGQTT